MKDNFLRPIGTSGWLIARPLRPSVAFQFTEKSPYRFQKKVSVGVGKRENLAHSVTVKNTNFSLIRPILEYGYPIYCCAFKTNLQELEQVQLSTARILTGLRNKCPSDIVLLEADLQPLSVRRNSILVKYNKLLSYNPRNRTSKFQKNWSNNQRLKMSSPYSQVISDNMILSSVERHHLSSYIDPSEDLPEVYFHLNLSAHLNKTSDPPEFLGQLASKLLVKFPMRHFLFILMTAGLKEAFSIPGSNSIWILFYSRSAIQHLYNCLRESKLLRNYSVLQIQLKERKNGGVKKFSSTNRRTTPCSTKYKSIL
ncbi:RNase H domain-containing protein [Trichonephila clavipes]|nr:RNase H domain-containing protein [Trichonephila clavipes]